MLGSFAVTNASGFAAAMIGLGRAILGVGECLILVGAASWAIGLAGRAAAGRAIAQIGLALYVGLAAGAPLGSILYDAYSFTSIVVVGLTFPLLALFVVAGLKRQEPVQQQKGALSKVLKTVWPPGIGLAFASLGYGATMTYSVLLFVERGWQPAWMALTVFASAFVLARVLLGHLPDRKGGARIAQIFACVQSASFALVAFAPFQILGLAGFAIAGFGYSLVYPGLGLEAVLRSPPESRSLAIGTYTAFLELTLGLVTPLLGLLASHSGITWVFYATSISTLGAILIASVLRASSTTA